MAVEAIGGHRIQVVAHVTVPPIEHRNELIRGPRWRVEAPPGRLRVAAVATFATLFVAGLVAMGFAMWLLATVGAPGWLVLAPFWLAVLAVLAWTLLRPAPAVTSNDDEAWITYAVLYVLVGRDVPRSTPTRVIVAVVLGGPTVGGLSIAWLLAAVGLTDA